MEVEAGRLPVELQTTSLEAFTSKITLRDHVAQVPSKPAQARRRAVSQ